MMWKKHSTYTLFAAALLLVLPALAVTFVPPDAGMMALLLLLMAINPLTLIQIGVQAGKNSPAFWLHPLLAVLFFAAGGYFLLKMGTSDLLFYAAGYLLLGYGALLLSARASKRRLS